ncbi:hypothetical protein BCR37DRAFT_384309 [Protomyces lactucae-debilis]|uniref:RING-type domain-containing protein n=1 Tax=Protomyces lactucae-debilis TaxID=2754530 RepID=A0A1Y2EUM4_PROLT|nr:uncharacterized protein BCR37DRAFT_384309 [Protomyces lactucae-debilis]ORY74866.1 hypothetical protein BCR37DRAFT_384309 [Protomyces lactucae-debilis]
MDTIERLQALEDDFTKLRKQLNCHICTELMFEPMVLTECGHTFCYGCSYDWLKTHKTCPTCRAKVRTKPTPIYLIRELVDVFVNRIELQSPLDEGAVLRQHQEEQRLVVASHRDDSYPGLFPDIPKHGGRLVDHEDRVMRCINCHWEIDGTVCAGCGQDYGSGDSGEDYTDNESLGYDDDADAFANLDDEEPNEYDHEDSFIDNGPSSQLRVATQDDSLLDDDDDESQTESFGSSNGLPFDEEDVYPLDMPHIRPFDQMRDHDRDDEDNPYDMDQDRQNGDEAENGEFLDEFDGFPDEVSSDGTDDRDGGHDHPIDIESDYGQDDLDMMDEDDLAQLDAPAVIPQRPRRRIICDSDDDDDE